MTIFFQERIVFFVFEVMELVKIFVFEAVVVSAQLSFEEGFLN